MKLSAMFLIIGLLPIASAGQNPPTEQSRPAVEVLKFGWSKELVGWEKDPFKRPIESYQDMQKKGDTTRRQDARRTVNAEENIKAHQKDSTRAGFRYKVTLKNNSAKTIKSVDWDYIFFDPAGASVIGHHQFTSEEKIEPGKTKQLSVVTFSPPVPAVDVNESKSKALESAKANVVIMRIEYTDGAVWEPQ